MREIPSLQEICLRSVGSHACSTEKTFRENNQNACNLLRLLRMNCPRIPCIGPLCGRKGNHYPPNEVDLHHPFATVRYKMNHEKKGDEEEEDSQELLVLEYGNAALDILQLYIDSLVEMGRFDDSRLGVHFFQQWKANCCSMNPNPSNLDANQKEAESLVITSPPPKKRPRRGGTPQTLDPVQTETGSSETANNDMQPSSDGSSSPIFTAISFHNCTMGETTIAALIESGLCESYLAVLDLTGVRGLTDDMVQSILIVSPHLQRLSIKNCRKLTKRTLETLASHNPQVRSLDIGGCGNNMTPLDVLSHLPPLQQLVELHASGLLWSDADLKDLVQMKKKTNHSEDGVWKKLSLGFSRFTQTALRESLLEISDSLTSLALPFCETVVDNALLGILGRNLPHIRSLDLRGNPNLYTLTGFYDGRASADLPIDDRMLTVLARYTGITESSVEETRRVHPTAQLQVFLGTGGMGAGIE